MTQLPDQIAHAIATPRSVLTDLTNVINYLGVGAGLLTGFLHVMQQGVGFAVVLYFAVLILFLARDLFCGLTRELEVGPDGIRYREGWHERRVA